MCRVLNVSRSGYNDWRKRGVPQRQLRQQELLAKIKKIDEESRGNYGWPRILRELRKEGIVVNHKTVEELMKKNGIQARRKRKFKPTTNSNHNLPVAECVLERNFSSKKPNEVWVGAITYIATVGSLTGTTTGSGSIVIDNDSALNLLSTTADSILMISADGDLTVNGPLSARTAIHLLTAGTGDLGLNQATSRTITATVLGQGSITDTSGGVLSASGSISLSSGISAIGSLNKPIKTSTRLVNVVTDASALISNRGKLGFGTVDVSGMLSVLNDDTITVKQPMTSVGSLSLAGSPGSDVNITIAATAGNPAASVGLKATGTGHIRMSGAVVADTLMLLTEGGSITGVTDVASIMAVTGAGGSVALTNLGAAAVSGTSGGAFTVTSNGSLSAGNISAAAGDVVLRAALGQVSVSPGATISASNGNVILNARDQAAGTIFLGTGATVSATGPTTKTGNVSIFIGNALRKENTSTPTNVVESITGTGQIFVGANSILCNAPTNTFTADSRTIVFSTGSSPAAAITLNGGVNIFAQVSYKEETAAEEDAIVDTGEWDESLEGLAAEL